MNAFLFNNFASAKTVDIRKALTMTALSSEETLENGTKVKIEARDAVAFEKDPDNRSELSNKDITLAFTFRQTVGSESQAYKISAPISTELWDALDEGRELIKVPYAEDYNRSDIKGAKENLKKLAELDVKIYVFDAWDDKAGQYPTDSEGKPIYENFIAGLPGEFEIDPDQPRKKDNIGKNKKAATAKSVKAEAANEEEIF